MLSREELERCATEASTPQPPAIVGTLSGACLPSGACKSAAASVAGLIATLKDLLEKDQTYAEARTDQAVLDWTSGMPVLLLQVLAVGDRNGFATC
jgi:hypothetical protein